MQFTYKFVISRQLDRQFVESTISNSLRQLYGIAGMARFNEMKIDDISDDKVTMSMEDDLIDDFWCAMIMQSTVGATKYRVIKL